MTVTIDIPDALFARLQKHAVPLVDTAVTVLARAIDALDAASGKGAAPEAAASQLSDEGFTIFDPADPPDLRFAEPTRIILEGAPLPKAETYWNALMLACVRRAAQRGLSSEQIAEQLVVPAEIGEKLGGGYTFIEEAGVSVQGQSAQRAWLQTHQIAAKLGLALRVDFRWQRNANACRPGAVGRFEMP